MPDYEKIAESVEVPGTERIIPVEELLATQKAGNVVPQVEREYFPVNHPKYAGIAAAKGYNQETQRLKKTSYSHDAMIDVILANPTIKHKELAETFGHGENWVSRIIGSDAFQAALAKRRDELTDPFLVATLDERMRGMAFQSLDILAEKLELTRNADLALKALDISSKALGFGARAAGPGQTNQFIIQLPPKSANSADWAAEHHPIKQIGASNG